MTASAARPPRFFPILLGFWFGALCGAALMYVCFGSLSQGPFETLHDAAQPEYSSTREAARIDLIMAFATTVIGWFGGSALGGWAAYEREQRKQLSAATKPR